MFGACTSSLRLMVQVLGEGQYGFKRFMRKLKQKPDQNFVGPEHLLEQKIDQGPRAIGEKCDPNKFSEVFEIPVSELGTREIIIHVSVDLVSHGYGPNVVPNARVIRQREYWDPFPFIVLTLCAYA